MTERADTRDAALSFCHSSRHTCQRQDFPNSLNWERHDHRHLIQGRRIDQHHTPPVSDLAYHPTDHTTCKRHPTLDRLANPHCTHLVKHHWPRLLRLHCFTRPGLHPQRQPLTLPGGRDRVATLVAPTCQTHLAPITPQLHLKALTHRDRDRHYLLSFPPP